MKYQSLFSGGKKKKKKIIGLSSAEIAQEVVKVKLAGLRLGSFCSWIDIP